MWHGLGLPRQHPHQNGLWVTDEHFCGSMALFVTVGATEGQQNLAPEVIGLRGVGLRGDPIVVLTSVSDSRDIDRVKPSDSVRQELLKLSSQTSHLDEAHSRVLGTNHVSTGLLPTQYLLRGHLKSRGGNNAHWEQRHLLLQRDCASTGKS